MGAKEASSLVKGLLVLYEHKHATPQARQVSPGAQGHILINS